MNPFPWGYLTSIRSVAVSGLGYDHQRYDWETPNRAVQTRCFGSRTDFKSLKGRERMSWLRNSTVISFVITGVFFKELLEADPRGFDKPLKSHPWHLLSQHFIKSCPITKISLWNGLVVPKRRWSSEKSVTMKRKKGESNTYRGIIQWMYERVSVRWESFNRKIKAVHVHTPWPPYCRIVHKTNPSGLVWTRTLHRLISSATLISG